MKKSIKFLPLIILLVVLLLTIGYASFGTEFNISNTVATVRADKVVRVTNTSTTSGLVSSLDYDVSSIVTSVSLPVDSSITYDVTVTNLGNVPVAISNVSFTDGGNALSGITYTFNDYNENTKICNTNNVCTGNVSKTFSITITNNGDKTISANININFTFSEVYSVTYDNMVIGEVLNGNNYTYTFNNNPPTAVSVTGEYDSYNYTNNTLSIVNVSSDIKISKMYTITYNDKIQGQVKAGNDYTYTFTSEQPKSITVEGVYDSYNYNNNTLSIINVGSDIVLTGIFGKVEITRIDYVSSINVSSHSNPTFDGMKANFDVTFEKEAGATSNEFKIIYEVELTNDYSKDYIFRGFDFNPVVNSSSSDDTAILHLDVSGVEAGEVLSPGDVKVFQLILTLETSNVNGTYTASADTTVDTTESSDDEGSILASITPNTGDLRFPNELVEFEIEVISTFSNDKEFKLLSSNSNLQLVDSSGNSLGNFTILANSTDNYTIYVKKNDLASFLHDTATTTISLSSSGMANVTVGTLTFNVDISSSVDTDKVVVSNAAIAMYNETGKPPIVGRIDANWNRDDEGGTDIIDYVVLLYNSSGLVKTGHTNSGITSYSFTDMADDTYYVIVYGIDGNQNTGEEYVSSATTASGYATKSESVKFKWRFDVDDSGLNYLKVSGDKIAYLGDTYSTTISPTGSVFDHDKLPSSLDRVTMGGKNLTSGTEYSYNNSSGLLEVYNVNGDIAIAATADSTCLIEGTKILLANGKYKNIENIGYDDLLMVYSYETGEFVAQYPIWIEKTKKTSVYQENTFSDGTVLKTLGYHGVFETELNKFVSVDNPNEFHIGSKIAKLNKEKTGFETVTVKSIEYKRETINYYHVVSTRYYNVIANDLLTTDGTVVLSNLYGFTDDITWNNDIRNMAINDVYLYDEFKDTIPYYMFKGMRVEESKFLANFGLDLNTFKGYLKKNQNNPDMVKLPIREFNNNVWMVTTSEDNVTDLNKKTYLRYEGSIYTLPKSKKQKFVGWLNTSDNKIYKPGDQIEVYHGIYFKAIYE